MAIATIDQRLAAGGIVLLDGATGTELERRGVPMDPEAWCGPATLAHLDILEAVHRDYIAAGADVVTANTYASSPIMLRAAGLEDRFEAINRAAVQTARRARDAAGRDEVAVAGSLSHMLPMLGGTDRTDLGRAHSRVEMTSAFGALAGLLRDAGCELILLEMMYHPARMPAAFEAATASGLPVWAGFSARRGADGAVLSFATDRDIPFAEVVQVLADYEVAAAGVMHSASDVIADAIAILREVYDGPLTAYPDSGYFKMPNWQFEEVIAPAALRGFAETWIAGGVQVIGGCCGLSPEHIAALAPLKAQAAV